MLNKSHLILSDILAQLASQFQTVVSFVFSLSQDVKFLSSFSHQTQHEREKQQKRLEICQVKGINDEMARQETRKERKGGNGERRKSREND